MARSVKSWPRAVVPSEEERQKREQLADEAREAEERATAAAQKATEARKNLRKAKKQNIAQLPAAEKALRAAEKQAAIEEKKARAKGENVPRNWQPTEAGLIRRFGKALASPMIAVWRGLKGFWQRIPSGAKVRNQRGFVVLPVSLPKKKKPILPRVDIRALAPEELPKLGLEFGLLPDLTKEMRAVCAPDGRHSTPLVKRDKAKRINTVYLASKAKKIQQEINALKRGEGVVVEITTTFPGEPPKIRFGYQMTSGNIYGIKPHQGGRKWRLFPVEGPDFVVLNKEEYEELKRLFLGTTTRTDFLSSNKKFVDKAKVLGLFDGTKETQK